MKGRDLLLIGLDAADTVLVEKWTRDGSMPALASLIKQGFYTRLSSPAEFLAGSPWPSFYLSQSPARHAIYADFQWRHGDMSWAAPSSDWLPAVPFWRTLEPSCKVVAFDVPMLLGCGSFSGYEVHGWATHDKLSPTATYPPSLLGEMSRKFVHAPLPYEGFGADTFQGSMSLRDRLIESTRAAAGAMSWLLEREWNLAIVCLSALHRGGHRLFGSSSVRESLSEDQKAELESSLRMLYVECDRALGTILQSAQAKSVCVFSLHGMMHNSSRVDLLDDMLGRILSNGDQPAPKRGVMKRAINTLPNPLRRAIGASIPHTLRDRLATMQSNSGVCWEHTKAFAMRADHQGYIRLNLEGREALGAVEPGREAELLTERIVSGLSSFTDADTGECPVECCYSSAELFGDGDRLAHLPDIIVRWKETSAQYHRVLHSDRHGRVARSTPGRVPNGRSGNHRGEGFLVACAPDIAAGSAPRERPDIIDLAPTFLSRLSARSTLSMSGRCIPELCAVTSPILVNSGP